MLRAGRLTAMGAGNQPALGAKKAAEHEEAVIIFLRETATETVLSLPSFITASDMREVSATVSLKHIYRSGNNLVLYL